MQIPDLINGLFEVIGGIMIWLNVLALMKDKEVKGVNWATTAFFTSWGYWNLWYYPSLNQWMSFVGGLAVVSGNTAWVYLYLKYRSKKRSIRCGHS
jgi:uncharacterized membrane protein YfcA